MLDGKKQVAERAVYSAIEGAAKKLKSENPVEVLEKAIANVSPDFEVKSRRVGGANYQIPFPIAGHRQLHFAFSWLVQSARARKGMLRALELWTFFGKKVQQRNLARKRRQAHVLIFFFDYYF